LNVEEHHELREEDTGNQQLAFKHDQWRFGLGSTMALILMKAHEDMRGSGHAA
jgi:hypothetical protein